MATIQSQMVLNDGMSAVLRKITSALDTTLAAFEQMQRASGEALELATIEAARGELVGARQATDQWAESFSWAAEEEEKLNRGIERGTSLSFCGKRYRSASHCHILPFCRSAPPSGRRLSDIFWPFQFAGVWSSR